MSHRDKIVDVTVGRSIARERIWINPVTICARNIPSGMLTSWKRIPALGYLSLWCLTGAPGAVPQIREQIIDVIKVNPEEWMSKRIV